MGNLTFSELMEGPVPELRMTGGRGKTPKRVKFFFSGPAENENRWDQKNHQNVFRRVCRPKLGKAKIKDMMGRKKAQKTKRALGPSFIKKGSRLKTIIAHKFRKKFGIRNVGKSA